jgi:hypothetical protein
MAHFKVHRKMFTSLVVNQDICMANTPVFPECFHFLCKYISSERWKWRVKENSSIMKTWWQIFVSYDRYLKLSIDIISGIYLICWHLEARIDRSRKTTRLHSALYRPNTYQQSNVFSTCIITIWKPVALSATLKLIITRRIQASRHASPDDRTNRQPRFHTAVHSLSRIPRERRRRNLDC